MGNKNIEAKNPWPKTTHCNVSMVSTSTGLGAYQKAKGWNLLVEGKGTPERSSLNG